MHKKPERRVAATLLGLAAIVQAILPLTPARGVPAVSTNVFGSFNLSIRTLEPSAQVGLLSNNGYEGIVTTSEDAGALRKFLELPAVQTGKVKVIANFYAWKDLSKPIDRDEMDAMARELKRAKADLWVTFLGAARPRDLRARIGQLADVANVHGVTVVLYPHHGGALVTTEEAVQWMKAIGRQNIKVALHLCHEIKAGNGARLPQIIRETAPYLAGITINGADRDVGGEGIQGDGYGYERSIQTLGQGDFNVRDEFYLPLIRAGYKGPIVLHDFGIKDPPEHFRRSMAVWKLWSEHAAQQTAVTTRSEDR